MDNNISMQLVIELAKKDLRAAVRDIQQRTGLPIYILSMILSEVKADMAAGELECLVASLTKKEEPKAKEE